MVRTNIVLDEALVEKVMRLYRLRSKREAVDFALRQVAGDREQARILELEGIGWQGDLTAMREDHRVRP